MLDYRKKPLPAAHKTWQACFVFLQQSVIKSCLSSDSDSCREDPSTVLLTVTQQNDAAPSLTERFRFIWMFCITSTYTEKRSWRLPRPKYIFKVINCRSNKLHFDFRFSLQWLWRVLYSEMWSGAVRHKYTTVSEERTASNFKAEYSKRRWTSTGLQRPTSQAIVVLFEKKKLA